MKIARVVGQVVSTLKHKHLAGYRLLVVQPEDTAGLTGGGSTIAVDLVGADIGERILLVDDGSAARCVLQLTGPIRAMIVGHVDEVHT